MTKEKEYFILDSDNLKVANFKYDRNDRLVIKDKRFSKRLINEYIKELKLDLPTNIEVLVV